MEKKIVKAEILLSRQCPLSCSYCGMKNDKENNRTPEEWADGIRQLNKLGCEFIAFYGAEPFIEFDKLCFLTIFCNFMEIDTTVITAGHIPNFRKKLKEFYLIGGRSLSMSYDPLPSDISTKFKSKHALSDLLFFKNLGDVRDVAAIATLSSKNFKALPSMIKKMSDLGVWTFFDFIHTNRGQKGSKCAVVDDSLLLTPIHYEALKDILNEVLCMKKEGYLCHTSEHFIKTVLEGMDHNNIYSWTCSGQDASWVTIDCDGSVIPCDDFCGDNIDFDMTDIYERWEKFVYATKVQVMNHDCQCCWNTHIDAHGILSGDVNINDYIHGDRKK